MILTSSKADKMHDCKMQQKNMFELLERRKHHRLVYKKNVTVILYLK